MEWLGLSNTDIGIAFFVIGVLIALGAAHLLSRSNWLDNSNKLFKTLAKIETRAMHTLDISNRRDVLWYEVRYYLEQPVCGEYSVKAEKLHKLLKLWVTLEKAKSIKGFSDNPYMKALYNKCVVELVKVWNYGLKKPMKKINKDSLIKLSRLERKLIKLDPVTIIY